jgi:hypothetical protein
MAENLLVVAKPLVVVLVVTLVMAETMSQGQLKTVVQGLVALAVLAL